VWSDTLCSSLPLTKHLAQVLSVGFEGLQHVVQLQPWLLQVVEGEDGEQPCGLQLAAGSMGVLSWMVQVRSGSAEAWGSAVGRDALCVALAVDVWMLQQQAGAHVMRAKHMLRVRLVMSTRCALPAVCSEAARVRAACAAACAAARVRAACAAALPVSLLQC
jgi:hypothetical protein